MTLWWKLGIWGIALVFYTSGVWEVHTWRDGAEMTAAIEAANAKTTAIATERDKIAASYESDKTAQDAKIKSLTLKWKSHEKTDVACPLAPDAISLLRAGSGAQDSTSR